MTNHHDKEYYNVFIPAPDVYAAGGREVFRMLRQDESDKPTNLLVIPDTYLTQLERMKGVAVEDSLAHIERIAEMQKKTSVASLGPGLDAVIYSTDGARQEKDVEESVRQQFRQSARESEEARPSFISNDVRRRISLERQMLLVEKAEFLLVNKDVVLDGMIEPDDDSKVLDALYSSNKSKSIPLEQAIELMGREDKGMDVNQFVRLRAPKETLYAKVVGDFVRDKRGTRILDVKNPHLQLLDVRSPGQEMRVGKHKMRDVLGISPRDMDQYLALQHGLLNPDVEILFLAGSQGSGKTLLSYVAAVDQTLWWDDEVRKLRGWGSQKGGLYSRMLLLKPTDIMGGKSRDVGFLPGDLYQKLNPHLQPYIDSHKESEALKGFDFRQMILHPDYANDFGSTRTHKGKIAGSAYLSPKREMVEVVHSGFIRGRSIPDAFLLIDEGQNYTPYEMKTILERTGEGTKVVVMGDPLQQDNPKNTHSSNGFTHAISHLKNKPYSMVLALGENYRSQLSEDMREWHVYPS